MKTPILSIVYIRHRQTHLVCATVARGQCEKADKSGMEPDQFGSNRTLFAPSSEQFLDQDVTVNVLTN